ncbi:putative nucleic-acid-binding protein [Hoeflea marina]|uniref:Putative nucleic-acid-binding protein n=1 Tax=Hoeflea marina TaxID=274592 RepID=A0A317PC72_9HYPH|nr:type II toxin-antitoxin system VapC family toxin [Hoeflea marina]PWV95493.1 putative nucleic-acid-binding protein [Hoeflea marina]
MIAVDTNVLLRYFVHDDHAQFESAKRFFNERTSTEPAYISLVVLAEFAWVLRRRYRYSSAQVLGLLQALLDTAELSFELEDVLAPYFSGMKELKGDVADHLVALSSMRAACSHSVTFDRAASKAVHGMELLA